MSPEFIGIVTTGMALAGLLISLFAWIRQDIREQGRLLGDIRERLSRLEGLIEGLFRPRPIPSPFSDPEQHDQAA